MSPLLRKFTAFIGVFVVILLSSTPVLAISNENPYQLISQVADKTFKRINTDKEKINADPNHMKVIVQEELMPYIDSVFATRRILHKVKASKADKRAFHKAFKSYLVTTYATVFAKYDNQEVVFAPEEPFADKRFVEVKTTMVNEGADDLLINFKVRKNKKTGIWKAYDLKAQGVSLLDSKRAELIGLLRQQGGVAKVTEILNEKANADI